MVYKEPIEKFGSPVTPEHALEKKAIVSRMGGRIWEGVRKLQEANPGDLLASQQTLAGLDHVLLSDIATEPEAEEIITLARSSGILGLSQALHQAYQIRSEKSLAEALLSGQEIDSLSAANHLLRSRKLAANEVELAGINGQDRVLFIGSGLFPITAIEYARQTGCQVDCVGCLSENAETSRRVINRLGLDQQIRVQTAEDWTSFPKPYSVIVVAAPAQPKQDVIDNLEENCGDGTRVLVRTTTGLRQFISPAAEFQTAKLICQNMIQAENDQVFSTMLFA